MRSLLQNANTPQELARALEAYLDKPAAPRDHAFKPAIGPFGGFLRAGFLHEWFVSPTANQSRRSSGGSGQLALGISIELARAALAQADIPGPCLWIGRPCWAAPTAIARACPALLGHSIFIDPPNREQRLWALDLALRHPGVGVAIADGSGLGMADSRRLQLAAEKGGTLGVLLRPPWEMGEISAAQTRWRVTPESITEDTADQGWKAELLRCKGLRPTQEARHWSVRRNHAKGTVSVAPAAADRCASQTQDPAGEATSRWNTGTG